MPATLIAPLNSCVGLFLLEDDFPEFSVERIAVRPKIGRDWRERHGNVFFLQHAVGYGHKGTPLQFLRLEDATGPMAKRAAWLAGECVSCAIRRPPPLSGAARLVPWPSASGVCADP